MCSLDARSGRPIQASLLEEIRAILERTFASGPKAISNIDGIGYLLNEIRRVGRSSFY
jgi:hypothetical protein